MLLRIHLEQAWALGRSERRKREVVAGRAALRSALRAVGWSGDKALLASPQGRPEVPAGFTGSITHKDGEALAVGAVSADGRTLGIDSVVVGRDRSAIASRVLRAAERERAPFRPGSEKIYPLRVASTRAPVDTSLPDHPVVLLTGATSGIGLALARKLGDWPAGHLVLSAR